jgi:uncharacterized peroxidase-related enzyme
VQDDRLVSQLAEDYTRAELSPADRVMLDYAAKVTRTPAAVTKQEVETLKAAGFSESAVLDICQVAAYYAFVNRLADGLGVELEEQPAPE